MEDTNAKKESNELVARAKVQLARDMEERGIAAILWNNGTAGFHYIPEIIIGRDKDGKDIVVRVTGLYAVGEEVYAIEEGAHGSDLRNYYDTDTDAEPTVVTLTASLAKRELGNPQNQEGYTAAGTNAEWLTIADCYFEALNER